jgi:hypothetical protein
MVRFNNLSVLRRLDLDNTKSVQKVLDILAVTLQRGSTTIEKKTVSGHKLTVMESQWTNAILRAIERNKEYPLLARAILRLCAARQESVVQLNIAIQELEDLTEEDVLIVPESHEEEYAAAVAKFKEMPHSKNQTLMEESYVRCFSLYGFSSKLTAYRSLHSRQRTSQEESSVNTAKAKLQKKPPRFVDPTLLRNED